MSVLSALTMIVVTGVIPVLAIAMVCGMDAGMKRRRVRARSTDGGELRNLVFQISRSAGSAAARSHGRDRR
jgi:hypothetical protein